MNLLIRLGPSTAQLNYVLTQPGDYVEGLEFDSEGKREVVRFFRGDRAAVRNRGGQLDTMTFTMTRRWTSLTAAFAWLVARRKALRGYDLSTNLIVEVRANYESQQVTRYLNAAITPGRSHMIGVSTIEQFTISGALADSIT